MGKAKPQSGDGESGVAASPASQAGQNTRRFPSVQLATLFSVLCDENKITYVNNKTKRSTKKKEAHKEGQAPQLIEN